MNFTHRNIRGRAGRVLTALLAVLVCLTSVRSTPAQTTPPSGTVPIRSIIPVVLDGSNGNITIGAQTLNGATPGFHLVALKRQPNRAHPESPDILFEGIFTTGDAAVAALTNISTQYPDAMIMVITSGSYGFPVWSVGYKLVGDPSTPGYGPGFGGTVELGGIGYVPLAFVGVVGLAPGTAPVSRWNSTRPVTGYLTPDSNGNYAFIQTDFVRYDINLNGDITVGKTTYTAASSFRVSTCNGQNAFRLVIVDREDPTILYANNTYCTASSDTEIQRLIGDIITLMSNGAPAGQTITDETRLVFLGSNGKPIPANWNFGTNGDARLYPFGQEVRKLGGYWETIVYLQPNDTYSLVGAPPPPDGTKGARKRARESSSVYPEISANVRPTGELHGVLARSGRGNWYSPLNADVSGVANLGFYEALAAPSKPFVIPSGPDEVAAFQYIAGKLCSGTICNIRDLYDDLDSDFDQELSTLQNMLDKNFKNCDVPSDGADPTFCRVRGQLLTEFVYVNNILKLHDNMSDLWQATGSVTLAGQLAAYNTIKAQLNPPDTASSQSLAEPLVNFFLGLASFIPEIGPVFGLADLAFNFGTSLATDQQGRKKIDLTSTLATQLDQATDQFVSQGASTGTFFKLIFQDWGKLSALGGAMGAKVDSTSPWYWDTNATTTMLNNMLPAIKQASYQNIMAAAYAVGSYMPDYKWGQYPLSGQPQGYPVGVARSCVCTPLSYPFTTPAYIPFTFPKDPGNQWADDPRSATIMSDFSWLGISARNTPIGGSTDDFHYSPPSPDVLTLLFNPVWKNGLGVYRPAFFESWPFPRVACGLSFGDRNGYSYSGGCNWSAAAAAPEHLAAGRHVPRTSVTVRAVQTSRDQPRKPEVDVMLSIHNNGTMTAQSISIDSITLRTLGGVGQATLVSPLLPIRLTNLRPGESTSVFLKLNVPFGAPRISLTQAGTITSGNLREPKVFKFSEAQSLFVQ